MSIEIQPRAVSDADVATAEIDRNLRTPGEVFLRRLQRTLELLERFPYLGESHQPESQDYLGLRTYTVRGWTSYAVFYLPRPDGISVV